MAKDDAANLTAIVIFLGMIAASLPLVVVTIAFGLQLHKMNRLLEDYTRKSLIIPALFNASQVVGAVISIILIVLTFKIPTSPNNERVARNFTGGYFIFTLLIFTVFFITTSIFFVKTYRKNNTTVHYQPQELTNSDESFQDNN